MHRLSSGCQTWDEEFRAIQEMIVKAESLLFQRMPIALQRYNAVLLHESFVGTDDPDF